MRVIPLSREHNERGAVLAIVCVSMATLIGAAAFAVDAGGAWQAKRRLHTATDAAALAAAQDYAFDDDGCAGTDDTYVAKNDDAATVTECQRVGDAASGYVTVSAERTVQYAFARIFGIENSKIESSTTAQYGVPLAVTGLRPLAICIYSEEVQEWLNPPDGPIGPSGPITLPFTSADLGCGETSGNWQWLDIDGGGGGADELAYDLRYGSEESVAIPGIIEPKTGRVSSVNDDLQYLLDNEIEFPIPLFNLKTGTGNNTQYHAVGVATVKLLSFNVGGSQDDDSFTFIFTPKTIQGTCCSGDALNAGTKVVNICAVNSDFDVSRCQP
jgi:Flp pilus assembly protein TadG